MNESENIITADFLKSQGFSPTIVERFWAKVQKTETCWLWTGLIANTGYGAIYGRNKQAMNTHVLSWILHNGIMPTKCILHNCPNGDNRKCVNPAHLWHGTRPENSKDMVAKGRSTRGEKNPMSKLTTEIVIGLRKEYAEKKTFHRVMAARLGLPRKCITDAINGTNWGWIGH